MILGVGVDIVDVARFERTLNENPKLIERLFVSGERNAKPSSLAARFAAKEALMKALGQAVGLSFQEVEVRKDENGRPFFELSGSSLSTIEAKGVTRLHLSLSHDGGMAIAQVVAEVD